MTAADQPTVIRRFLVAAVALPAVFTAIGVALQIWAMPDLPDPIAIHWGADGNPDGFGSAATSLVMTAALAFGLPALFAASSLPALRRGDRGPSYRFLASAMAATSALIVTLVTWLTVMQRGLDDARAAGPVWWALGDSALNAALFGFIAWRIQPNQTQRTTTLASVEPLSLAAGERVSWLQEATLPRRWAVVVTLVTAATAVAALAAWFIAERSLAISLTITAILLVLALLTSTLFRVRVDTTGLTVRSLLGWPRFHVPIDDITEVAVIDVNGLGDFGGFGLRWMPGRFGIILRRGSALQVTRRSGRMLAVTVDDAATGAATLDALRVRNS